MRIQAVTKEECRSCSTRGDELMTTDGFFDETREQSQVKSEIVEKYFYAWARIISATQDRYIRAGSDNRIGYVDLFAGPGRYKDGAVSTPLRILERAIADSVHAERLVTIFNDKDEAHVRELQAAIDHLPGIDRLRYKPQIWNHDIGSEIAKAFEGIHTIPLLAFVDPWGYKGLCLRLVNAFLKDWGCDCIFFFNYNRINMGLSNPMVKEHMAALFGDERDSALTEQLDPLCPAEREVVIVNALAVSLKEFGHRFVLPFCFKNETGTRTSHHLILVTKHFRGYEVMKEIMAKSSSDHHQGVPSFTYLPSGMYKQGLLFELNRPLDDLRAMLLDGYAGRTLTLPEIYERHSVDRPYLQRNYAAVLAVLEDEGVIAVERPSRGRRGFGAKTRVTFPLQP